LSEASVRIFKFWKQLYDEKLYVNPGIEAWTESNQIFWAQKAGMAMESTAAVRRFLTGGLEGGYEVGVSVLPTPKGIKRHGIMLGGGTLFITKGHPFSSLPDGLNNILDIELPLINYWSPSLALKAH